MTRRRALRPSVRGCVAACAALCAVLWPVGPAAAHTQSGSLGASASATDFYQITCSDDGTGPPASLVVQVLDAAPVAAPLVAVHVQRGSVAANSTDAVDGDATPSPQIALDFGAGVFDVLVYKTGAGSESYTLTYHCMTGAGGSGDHTGSGIATRQNQ